MKFSRNLLALVLAFAIAVGSCDDSTEDSGSEEKGSCESGECEDAPAKSSELSCDTSCAFKSYVGIIEPVCNKRGQMRLSCGNGLPMDIMNGDNSTFAANQIVCVNGKWVSFNCDGGVSTYEVEISAKCSYGDCPEYPSFAVESETTSFNSSFTFAAAGSPFVKHGKRRLQCASGLFGFISATGEMEVVKNSLSFRCLNSTWVVGYGEDMVTIDATAKIGCFNMACTEPKIGTAADFEDYITNGTEFLEGAFDYRIKHGRASYRCPSGSKVGYVSNGELKLDNFGLMCYGGSWHAYNRRFFYEYNLDVDFTTTPLGCFVQSCPAFGEISGTFAEASISFELGSQYNVTEDGDLVCPDGERFGYINAAGTISFIKWSLKCANGKWSATLEDGTAVTEDVYLLMKRGARCFKSRCQSFPKFNADRITSFAGMNISFDFDLDFKGSNEEDGELRFGCAKGERLGYFVNGKLVFADWHLTCDHGDWKIIGDHSKELDFAAVMAGGIGCFKSRCPSFPKFNATEFLGLNSSSSFDLDTEHVGSAEEDGMMKFKCPHGQKLGYVGADGKLKFVKWGVKCGGQGAWEVDYGTGSDSFEELDSDFDLEEILSSGVGCFHTTCSAMSSISSDDVLGSSMSFNFDDEDDGSVEKDGIQKFQCKHGNVFGYTTATGEVVLVEDWDIYCMNGKWIVKSALFVDVLTSSHKIGCFKRGCGSLNFFNNSDVSSVYTFDGEMKTKITRSGVERLACSGVALVDASGALTFTSDIYARCYKGKWMVGSLDISTYKISCFNEPEFFSFFSQDLYTYDISFGFLAEPARKPFNGNMKLTCSADQYIGFKEDGADFVIGAYDVVYTSAGNVNVTGNGETYELPVTTKFGCFTPKASAPTFIEASMEDEDGTSYSLVSSKTSVKFVKGVMQVECGSDSVFGYVNALSGKLTVQQGYFMKVVRGKWVIFDESKEVIVTYDADLAVGCFAVAA